MSFKTLFHIAQTFLMMATFAASCHYYERFDVVVPPVLYIILGFGIIGVSVVWFLFHLLGGGIFGVASGGIINGLKIGGTIGLGMSLGRLWPYAMIWAAGAFFFGPPWHTVAAFLLGMFLFVVNRLMGYVWERVDN